MPMAQSILHEFDHEMATTRSLLERIPEARASWKPHPRSFSLGELAAHVASLPGWTGPTLTDTELDLAPPGGPPFAPPRFQGVPALLRDFDRTIREARDVIARASDSDFQVPWTLKKAGSPLFTMPRAAVLRAFVLSHLIHHRGQLSVYLRLCDVPLPPIYGPTADTPA